MRLPRMTTRLWMIAVALAGILLGAAHLVHLNRQYRQLASHYRAAEAASVRQAEEFEKQFYWAMWEAPVQYPLTVPDKPWHLLASDSQSASRFFRWAAAQEAELAAKYERVARCPWLPVPTDPPEPK